MADYKEIIVSGEIKKWTRSDSVVIKNPLGGVPFILYHEIQKMKLPDGTIVDTGIESSLKEYLSNPATPFNLVNPLADDSIIGTAQYQDVYIMLYSLYKHLANIRDNPPLNQIISEPI